MTPPRHGDVVVTGRGVVSSIGEGADAFFDALLAKRSGIADGVGACTAFDPEHDDDAQGGAPRRPLHAARGRRGGAGRTRGRAGGDGAVEPERLGVLMGTGVGGLMTLERECRTGWRAASAPSRRTSCR